MELLVKNSWAPARRSPISQRRARALIRSLLQAEGIPPRCEISLLFCDEELSRELNRTYLGEDYATDVLAFPQQEIVRSPGSEVRSPGPATPDLGPRTSDCLLGDIAICVPVAARQAAAAGHSLADEVAWLLLHGALHLLGYDDATPEGLAEMIRRQRVVLAAVRC